MAIDPKTIVWDDSPPQAAAQAIDPNTIQWDDTPSEEVLEIDVTGGIPQSQAPAELRQPRATDTMSGLDRFRAGLGKSLVDTGYGIAQFVTDRATPEVPQIVRDVVERVGSPGYQETFNRVADIYAAPGNRLREIAADRKSIDADLTGTGAGFAGNLSGVVLQTLGPGLAARGSAAANALLPTSVRGNALYGGAVGALQPVSGDGERTQNTLIGGGLGGLGAAVPKAAGAAYDTGRNLLARGGLTATDRQAANVLAREATNPNQLTITESTVPGVQRTLGEASNDPGLMALENVMRARDRGAFDPIDLRNNAARVSSMQRIAGTDADMAAAEAARDASTRSLRDQAFAEGEQTAQDLQQARALMIPNAGTGMAQLRQQIGAIASSGAGNPSVQSATNAVSRALDQAGDSVGGLYNTRKYIGDLLNGRVSGDDASARAASRELIAMRDLIDESLAQRAPSFPEYLDAYRNASKPINRMEVGREALSRASSTMQDQLGNPILTPSGVSRVTNDLDAIAAKATGFKKAKASEILSSDDLASLRAVQDDMQRIAQRSRSATPGSQTMERMSVGERAAVRGVAGRLPWVGPLFEHFESAANQRLNERLAYLMANPAEAKRVMAALPKQDADVVRRTLGQLSLATGRSSQPTTTSNARE